MDGPLAVEQEVLMVEQIPFPDEIADLHLLDRVSYRDAFAATVRESRTAEEWLRLALAGAPPALLSGVRTVQRGLGLDLAPVSHDHPLGWEILGNDPDLFVLGADGPRGSARLAGIVGEGRLVFTTQADFGLRTRILWVFVQFAHRAIARYLIGKAVGAQQPEQPATDVDGATGR